MYERQLLNVAAKWLFIVSMNKGDFNILNNIFGFTCEFLACRICAKISPLPPLNNHIK